MAEIAEEGSAMNSTLRLIDGERPMSDHAERTVLGACLLEEDAFIEACETLTPESFALDSHRRIFAAMHKLHAAQYAIDVKLRFANNCLP